MNTLLRLTAVLSFAVALAVGGSLPGVAQDTKPLDPSAGQAAAMAAPGGLAARLAATGWANQSGSVMNFTYSANGSIQGTYVNNATGTGCQGTVYPLSGWINGNSIAWSVLWSNTSQNCNSVTAWAGYYDPNSDSLQTNWVLASQSGVQLGTDVFKYQ